jgi:hypothetical protein
MGNSNYSGGRYWDSSEAASISAATVALSDSIRDQVLGKFTTTGARDTALAALPSTERPGCLAYVSGVGWSAYDGATWRTIAMTGVTQESGTLVLQTSSVGIFTIPHSLGVAPGSAILTPEFLNTDSSGFFQAHRLNYVVRDRGVSSVLGYAVDSESYTPYVSAFIKVNYFIAK